jgi:hypothetical protein
MIFNFHWHWHSDWPGHHELEQITPQSLQPERMMMLGNMMILRRPVPFEDCL